MILPDEGEKRGSVFLSDAGDSSVTEAKGERAASEHCQPHLC